MQLTEKLLNFYRENDSEIEEKMDLLHEKYKDRVDPWGLNIESLHRSIRFLLPIYKKYFSVQVFGEENIPKDESFIAVANHSGQIPIDGMLIVASFIMGLDDPIILRAMGERFIFKLPLLGKLANESGTVLGDRKNCRFLLENDESILVFPEGTKGISKPTHKFYQLQEFTQGFYRLALEHNKTILPISVVGAEEFYPYVYHNDKIAKFFKTPAFPITPLFPLAGLFGAIPMPSQVKIYIGEPVKPNLNLSPTSERDSIKIEVDKIKKSIQDSIDEIRAKDTK